MVCTARASNTIAIASTDATASTDTIATTKAPTKITIGTSSPRN